jgi:hypothetical protein
MGSSLFLNLERILTLTQGVEYWFNTKTNTVEVGPQSLSLHRIGPFENRADAEKALEIVLERAKRLREDDEKDRWD